ncbi:Zn-dependent oxidoreductase [Rubrobacter taiwanensis]|jgi:NADPH:quinone reductase-like Zn-dependent oxidoreductase|uniref:Zn-dependent oxidoreductase n=1 Tax=Rubrobacter taiwanensis TaxID=185139 RepID=A0A4R1BQF0_9ACTN|nr:alcohol dehydrogenase family protein [Rubrobacter taiwanensis]TCJ19963.1 Zn-dependent oxidoreductase [Rubrobacter taiwanensis]
MKAVLLTGYGGLEKLEYREDIPVPRPGRDEVLIRVGAAGVNNTDLWTREGVYGTEDDPQATGGWRRGEQMEFPRIQGMDIVGRIIAVGDGVPKSRIGERVIVDFVLRCGEGEEGLINAALIGSERDGGFAEYVAVPAENAIAIDAPLSDEELATFPTAYLTAEHMLNRARVVGGETVFVTGASGGVGSALLQLARLRGARVLALVGEGKEDGARELGAEGVISRGVSDLSSTVAGITGGHPVDVVADVVGGETFSDLLRVLKPLGRYVTAGAIAGPMVQLDLRTLYLKHLELIGSTIGTRKEFVDMIGYIEEGKVQPLLAGTYPLSEIKRAQEDFRSKSFFGKLVLVP